LTTAFSSIAALLLSVLMLIGGNSLIGIVTPLRARAEGFPELTVGLLGSVYFAGMLAGTLAAPAIIRRGGHIRAYAAFVALAVVSVILMPVMVTPWAWLGCRALIGFVRQLSGVARWFGMIHATGEAAGRRSLNLKPFYIQWEA